MLRFQFHNTVPNVENQNYVFYFLFLPLKFLKNLTTTLLSVLQLCEMTFKYLCKDNICTLKVFLNGTISEEVDCHKSKPLKGS